MSGHHRYEPRHARKKGGEPEEPQPGTAAMAQGQPAAGVESAKEKPEQADNVVTGAEAFEEQQQDPELDDRSGAHP